MLGKGFFNVKPFNPQPYFDSVIVNLSGAQKFEDDTVFMPGRYRVSINAGSVTGYSTNGSLEYFGKPVIISKDITITERFIIRAYCGGKSIINLQNNSVIIGSNPYIGSYKVNGSAELNNSIPSVSHCFGNAGSAGVWVGSMALSNNVASSGNCLGNGVATDRGGVYDSVSSAGSCIHFIPVNGVFGTDMLFAFQSAGVSGYYKGVFGGGGSALGGGASGGVRPNGFSFTSKNGGDTLWGNGGLGVSDSLRGNNGIGIGCGKNGEYGAGAFFDKDIGWTDETNYVSTETDGIIKVTYLGPLNEEVYYSWGSNPSVKEPRVFTKNLNPQVGDQAWFFDFNNARTSYDIKDATQVTIQSSGTGVAPIVWVDNTGFYAMGTLGPAIYTLNRMSNDDIIIKW